MGALGVDGPTEVPMDSPGELMSATVPTVHLQCMVFGALRWGGR